MVIPSVLSEKGDEDSAGDQGFCDSILKKCDRDQDYAVEKYLRYLANNHQALETGIIDLATD